jgi:glucose-6-phosphate 1-dehydrogenase
MAGDATLFARRDEVEEAWKFIDHIHRAWHDSEAGKEPEMAEFVAGSWGPEEADSLLEEDGNSWRRL